MRASPKEIRTALKVLENLPKIMENYRDEETFRAIAAESGVSHSAWFNYEKGRADPTASQVIKILKVMT